MKDSVRAFVAIELPDRARTALAELVEQLKRARVRGLRPVSPTGIHLTLKFLGDVPVTQVESIAAEIRRAASGQRSFSVVLDGVGVFPKRGEPRVLWVGLDGDLPALLALHQAVEDSLERLGYARERRDFSPHLTVARIRDGTPSDERRRAREALLSATAFDSGLRIDVDHVSLMQSILLPEGAKYLRLARITLSGAAAQGTAH